MNKILHFAIRLIEFTSAWRIAATLFYNWIRLAASSGCCSLHLNVFCECLWTPNFFLHASIAYRNSTTQLISLIFKRELSLASASSSLYSWISHLSFCHFNRPKTKILFSKQGPVNKSCSNISNLLQLFLARKFKFLF